MNAPLRKAGVVMMVLFGLLFIHSTGCRWSRPTSTATTWSTTRSACSSRSTSGSAAASSWTARRSRRASRPRTR
jgi:hypothetical protein